MDQDILDKLQSGQYHIKTKTRFSKVVVSFVIIATLIFTIICLALFYLKGDEPTALIAAFYSFMGAEVLGLATVTWSKNRKGGK